MIRFQCDDVDVWVPTRVVDLESFRRWSDDDDFPEKGRISFIKGEVWVDMSKEQLFTHNDVKTEYAHVLRGLAKSARSGRYFSDGAFVSNESADVSNQPDGVYVSFDSLREGRVRVVEGRGEGHVELEGSPDLVLEVVSPSSVGKDTQVLRETYAAAGIREYWLVDARKEPMRFDVLRLSRGHYAAVRKQAGWVRSEVFGRWFRLTLETREDGFPEFTLGVRDSKPS